MKRMIFFDMDGTIADLYKVDNWLPKLRAYDPSPYAEAKVMHNMALLARLLNKVQAVGYGIGIISWGSKCSTPAYDEAVAQAKLAWLNQHLASVHFDAIHIVAYDTPKTDFMQFTDDILFDDNEEIRNSWTGEPHTPDEIIGVLKSLLAS